MHYYVLRKYTSSSSRQFFLSEPLKLNTSDHRGRRNNLNINLLDNWICAHTRTLYFSLVYFSLICGSTVAVYRVFALRTGLLLFMKVNGSGCQVGRSESRT